jgi:hypothetical protein
MRFNLGGALYTAAYGLSTAAESRPYGNKPGRSVDVRGDFAPHILIRGVSASARFPDLLKLPRERLELLQLGWRASDEG